MESQTNIKIAAKKDDPERPSLFDIYYSFNFYILYINIVVQ